MSTLQVTETYNQAFLAATPEIASEILDYSVKIPLWMADCYTMKPWPTDQNVLQQLIFRGSLPEVERGFDRWKKLANTAGCEPCVDDCSYNWTQFSGSSMERRLIQLMRREFKTPEYCVNEIKTLHEYEMVFNKIIENINMQVSFFKEMNIGMNFLTGIAKKLLVAGNGIQGNSQDPYSYRPLGAATLSKLNLRLLTKLYEGLRRRTDVVPFDVVSGKPIYAISASDELMDDLYLADANARVDLRFSSAADATLSKYNFMESIRGQFINAPILYPRRFNWDAGLNDWIEVIPYVNGLPAEIGNFSTLNPEWEAAVFEEVLVYGKNPFEVYYRPQVQSVGSGTSFGPEPTFMDTWQWVNVQTDLDPFRRQGFFATSAEIALSPQFSECYGILVPRPRQIAEYFPVDVCPIPDVPCGNDLPDVTCPCPLITSATMNLITPNRWFITFAVPVAGVIGNPIQLGIDTGGFIEGTLTGLSVDTLHAEVEFPAGTDFGDCSRFTTVFCDNTMGCGSIVINSNDCRADQTGQFRVLLENPIRAFTAGQVIIGFMGDGTEQQFEVLSADLLQNEWVLEYAAGFGPTDDPTGAGASVLEADLNCDRNGIIRVCVPTTTDATCPSCAGPVITQCA